MYKINLDYFFSHSKKSGPSCHVVDVGHPDTIWPDAEREPIYDYHPTPASVIRGRKGWS